jgi:hypothetical protein
MFDFFERPLSSLTIGEFTLLIGAIIAMLVVLPLARQVEHEPDEDDA